MNHKLILKLFYLALNAEQNILKSQFPLDITAIVWKLRILVLILGLFPILVAQSVKNYCNQNANIHVFFSVTQVLFCSVTTMLIKIYTFFSS